MTQELTFNLSEALTQECTVQIRKENKSNRTHTGVTIPYTWLRQLNLAGASKEDRKVKMTIDLKSGAIIIRKA